MAEGSASGTALREQQAQEAPKAKCKSLSPSVMDYWCDTQCAEGLKCPTNVCSCDGSVQLRETSKGAPTAPTWEDAHPSKAKHEVDTRTPKIDIVCKSLSPSVSEHWCRTTCLSGSHCPKDCACGDFSGRPTRLRDKVSEQNRAACVCVRVCASARSSSC